MHVYRKSESEPSLWTVGYFMPVTLRESTLSYAWYPLVDFDREHDAMCCVNFLNGGDPSATAAALR